MWVIFTQPGEIKSGRVACDGLGGSCHLLDDVVYNGAFRKHNRTFVDLSGETAAGAEIDEKFGGTVINDVLCRGRRGDFAPAAMEEQHRRSLLTNCHISHEPFAERRWLRLTFGI